MKRRSVVNHPTRSSSQTTCYVVAYDIPDDKRRRKIHKLLLGYGEWTQYSVFECFLTRKDFVLLQAKLAQHLVAATDSMRFYPLCATCVRKVETAGGPPPADVLVFIV
jgi:CRISPR-associated protein Cas2